MATPRRSARIQDMATPSTPSTPSKLNGIGGTPISSKGASRRSPFLPTMLEGFLLSIYPTTLVLGSLFALIDPAARHAPYNAMTQSHPPEFAPSYFAQKGNLFNVLFVKRGWFWVTLSYFLFLFTHPSTGPPRSALMTPKRVRGALRWALVTTWWIFVTQWFFGPAIIDRGFVLTGGQCDLVREAEKGNVDMDDTRQFLTGMACKASGGSWKGGHDISGHVFLLVLGSMFLLEEVLHVVYTVNTKEERTIVMGDGAIKSAEVEGSLPLDGTDLSRGSWDLGTKSVLTVSGLSLWMLLMTAAYFHTWFEKLTGLFVAVIGIFVTYFLPRIVPAWRNIIGMPGI